MRAGSAADGLRTAPLANEACQSPAPEVWFGALFLSAAFEGEPWSRAGDCIKLTATNGTRIWRLTGEMRVDRNIDGPFEVHRAVWPD